MEDFTMSKRIAFSSTCVVAALWITCHLHAAQISVPADQPSIQLAIDTAADGDVIIVSPGRYVENINFLGKGITVQSTNPEDKEVVAATIIDGNKAGSCVTIVDGRDCSLRGLTITNGNTEGSGGGVYCYYTSATISSNLVTGNYARTGGGGIAIELRKPAVVEGNTISGNSTFNYGGGVLINSRDCIVKDNTITSNSGPMGGGIFLFEEAQIIGNSICSNVAPEFESPGGWGGGWGGGICADGLLGYMAGNIICSNSAMTGGAFACSGAFRLTVFDNLISGNKGSDRHQGPAIFIPSGEDLAIAGNRIIDNCTPGVHIQDLNGSSSVTANTVVGNRGAGMFVQSDCERNMAVIDNAVAFNSGRGITLKYGGLLANNLIAGNSTDSDGGGVLLDRGAPILLNNTIIGNTAAGSGGGIRVYRSQAVIANTVLQHNTAANGPELHVAGEEPVWYQASLTVKSSNVAGGEAGAVIGDYATFTWGPGNIDADPLFVDPGRWDGDTFIPGDYHLLPGSPCIDGGTNDVDNTGTPEIEVLPATDIAGLPRIIDGNLDGTATVDIGAHEYLPGDVNYDGKVNVIDLLIVRNSLGRDPSSSPEARKADVNADGSVNVEDLLVVRGRLAR